ncbi:MAG: ABC transporter substrate-binding protein [Rhodospirillaceae bacterium]|nr:ABC transporter substrate-binding protein [Rhodospirillaceae bacterium]
MPAAISPRPVATALAAVALLLGAAGARSAEPQALARDIVREMADSVIAVLHAGADKATREATFRKMYVRNFDRVGIAVWAAGRAWRAASPEARTRYLDAFDDYIVAAYAYQLTRYKGERLRVDKTEADGRDTIVVSNLVHPDPREAREIEMKWRLHHVGSRLLVSDVVIDKISMALTEKRAFADWLEDKGGTLDGLTAKLREKIAAIEKK